jgi:prepilin peptidase CpaA
MAIIHWSYYILLVSLAIAVYTDITRHKIYNWLTFPTLVLGLLFAFVRGGGYGLLDCFASFIFAFAIAFILYITKGIYGGDVKLIAAIGAWVGKALVIKTLLNIFLAGAVLSILYTIKNGTFLATMAKVKRFFIALFVPGMSAQAEVQESLNEYVPYGIAISAGTALSLFYPDLFGLN